MNNLALQTANPATAASDTATGERSSYAKELRALGQALEARHVVALDLVAVADVYAIRAKAHLSKGGKLTIGKLWSAITGNDEGKTGIQTVDLRYSLEDIMKLDRLGRSKRTDPQGTPNPNTLSQVLRSAGSYLDLREHSSLIGISVHERWVTIRYQSADGQAQETRETIDHFYDYWVKMYLRRSQRLSSSHAEDRTLSGTWKQINELYDSPRRR